MNSDLPGGAASRADVLTRLRALPRRNVPHPGVFGGDLRYEDVAARFAESVTAAGGHCVRLAAAAVSEALDAHDAWRAARRVFLGPGLDLVHTEGAQRLDTATVTRLHDFAETDITVLVGAPGVAENGAVWIASDDPGLRAALVATQHLVLVVPAARLVHTMHQGYAAIDTTATGYGVWVAGPSKTADIEQSLVIGAHGPLSLLVLVTD